MTEIVAGKGFQSSDQAMEALMGFLIPVLDGGAKVPMLIGRILYQFRADDYCLESERMLGILLPSLTGKTFSRTASVTATGVEDIIIVTQWNGFGIPRPDRIRINNDRDGSITVDILLKTDSTGFPTCYTMKFYKEAAALSRMYKVGVER